MSTSNLIEFLKKSRVHCGHSISRRNPKMEKYINSVQKKFCFIDLHQTALNLKKAYVTLHEMTSQGKIPLFVGTKSNAKQVIEGLNQKYQVHAVYERWIGGFMTNSKVVFKSISKLRSLNDLFSDYQLQLDGGYTKKELVVLDKKRSSLKRYHNGVINLERVPDVLIVVDPVKEINAVREARTLGIPVIGIVDTDGDPDLVDICIPANDDGVRSIEAVLTFLAKAIIIGREEFAKAEAERLRKEEEEKKILEQQQKEAEEIAQKAHEELMKQQAKEKERLEKERKAKEKEQKEKEKKQKAQADQAAKAAKASEESPAEVKKDSKKEEKTPEKEEQKEASEKPVKEEKAENSKEEVSEVKSEESVNEEQKTEGGE